MDPEELCDSTPNDFLRKNAFILGIVCMLTSTTARLANAPPREWPVKNTSAGFWLNSFRRTVCTNSLTPK